MIGVKKENRMLKTRIEHLELQVSHLTNQFDYQGNIEPTRTLMNYNKNSEQIHNNTNGFMSEQSPMTYYDGNGFGAKNLNYSNLPKSQNMRSTGYNRGRTNLNSKHSLREVNRRIKGRDLSIKNGKSKNTLK